MRRGTIWLYWPTNGSGKRSPYARCGFTLGGREYRLATGERERGAALERAAALLAEECRRRRLPLPEGAFQDLGDRELALVAQAFLDDVRARVEAGTLQRNPHYHKSLETDLRCHVLPHFKRLDEIDRDSWRRVLAHVRARTGQRVTVTLRQMLKWAWDAGLVSAVPPLSAPPGEEVQRQQAHRDAMTEAELRRFLRAARRIDRAAWRRFAAMVYACQRKSTIEKITLRQVDFHTHFLALPTRMIKSRKVNRSIWMRPEFEAVLRDEIRVRRNIDPDEPIFGPFDLRAVFRQARIAAKVTRPGLTPHHFARHTWATITGANGASLGELMALGTWLTPGQAARYQHIDAQLSKAAQRRVRTV